MKQGVPAEDARNKTSVQLVRAAVEIMFLL